MFIAKFLLFFDCLYAMLFIERKVFYPPYCIICTALQDKSRLRAAGGFYCTEKLRFGEKFGGKRPLTFFRIIW